MEPLVCEWGEVNVPVLSQGPARPSGEVNQGTLGEEGHRIGFEPYAVFPWELKPMLGPYRRMACAGSFLPLLLVWEMGQGRRSSEDASGDLPMLVATPEQTLEEPATGAVTVWRRHEAPVALRCERR